MTKKREREGRDDNVPVVVVEDATERHLLKARPLLREAQSRLSSRDEAAFDSKDDEDKNDGEDPNG